MSPASGDRIYEIHNLRANSTVSIQLMSPASGDSELHTTAERKIIRFHSINVPSEWGLCCEDIHSLAKTVSIQLMSPASGDPSILNPYPARCPETVSEGQEKSSKTTNRQQEKNSQNPYPASDRSSQRKNQYYSHFT